MSEKEIDELIEKLIKIGLAQRNKNEFISLSPNIHLDQGSFISNTNHVMWRLEALKAEAKSRKDGYQFTATICADQESLAELRERIKTLIADYSKYLKDIPSQVVYQLNIDLLPMIMD